MVGQAAPTLGAGAWVEPGVYTLAHTRLDGLAVILAAAVAAVALIARTGNRRTLLRTLVWGAVAAIGFQVVHFAEHLLQAGYWLLHPTEAPWLTPWAVAGRDALAALVDGVAGTGNELLHLAGNLVFLAGLAAALLAVRVAQAPSAETGRLHWAVWIQGAHVAEHVLLTLTWMTGGQAIGVSTGLGLLQPGASVTGGVRVWVHFSINLLATVYAVGGLRELRTALRPTSPQASRSREPVQA